MMNARSISRLSLLYGCALAFSLCSSGLYASAAHHAKRLASKLQIEVLEQQWRSASLASDVPAMDRLLSDDFVGISWTGQMTTKALQLERLKKKTLVLTKLDLSEAKIKTVGAVAIVTSLARVEGTNEGSSVEGLFRYTRVYRRLPSGTWQITNFEATRLRDGSEINPAH